jgi:hypothetical protein
MAAWTHGRLAIVAMAVVLGQAPIARAEPPGAAALIWQAPVDCPDAAEVRARIERRLGSSLDRMVRGIAVDIAVSRDGGTPRFVARIARGVAGRDEVRVLTSARCDELTDAVAVVVARIASEARQPPGEVSPDRPGTPAAPVEAKSWGAGLRVMGNSGIGVIPGVGVAGELAGYLRIRSVVAELAAAQWLPNPRFLLPGAPGHIDVGLATATLRIGWASERMPLRAWLEGEIGTLDGNGASLHDPRLAGARWIAAGGGFGVAWPMARYARLVGTFEIVVPVEQAPFMLQDGTEVYRPGVVTARSGLGLEIGWW